MTVRSLTGRDVLVGTHFSVAAAAGIAVQESSMTSNARKKMCDNLFFINETILSLNIAVTVQHPRHEKTLRSGRC